MNATLLMLGLACLIAAIVGGGLKAAGFEFPVISSLRRQILLAALGCVLLIASRIGRQPAPASQKIAGPTQDAASQTNHDMSRASQRLRDSSYDLPGQGTPNHNGDIGGFCCTGETAAILTADKRPVGYVHVFDWPGQAMSVGGRTLVPGLTVRVSGARNLRDAASPRDTSSVVFLASSATPGATLNVKVGALTYAITLNRLTRQQVGGRWYIDMESARVHVVASVS